LVFFAGQYFLFPSTPEVPSPTRPEAQQAGKTPAQPAPAKPEPAAPETPRKDEQKQAQTAAPAVPRAQGVRPPQRLATVVTPLYRAVVSSEGGKLQELTLQYRGPKPMVIVGELGPGGLVSGPPGRTEPVPMELSTTDLRLGPQQPTGELVLTGEVGGLRVHKTLTFHADTYPI